MKSNHHKTDRVSSSELSEREQSDHVCVTNDRKIGSATRLIVAHHTKSVYLM